MSKWGAELDFLEDRIPKIYSRGVSLGIDSHGKGGFDLVTTLDLFIERELGKMICSRFPDDRIMGEEYSPNTPLFGRVWVVDPIDGTVNMAHGLSLYGVQVALTVDANVVLAVMYFPGLGQFVRAEAGQGAFCNGQRLNVGSRSNMKDWMISFGDFPHDNPQELNRQHDMMIKLAAQVSKIRMFGAASYDLLSVAAGHSDAHVAFAKNPWDLLPGILVCKEAGGVTVDITGQPYAIGADGIVAGSNSSIVAKLMSTINNSVNT